MDQLKDVLRGAVRYRFWIAVGISALLPLIAYFTASGPLKAEAKKAEDEIKAAHSDVQKYRSPGLPNDQYKPIADKKYDALKQDVDIAWRALYERQAPLLTWPESVQDYFRAWGRKWPEDVDPNQVQNVIIEYVNTYPDFVDKVYNSFSPWKAVDLAEAYPDLPELLKTDPEKAEEIRKKAEAGTGLVAAPPKEVLLKPKTSTVFNTTEPPSLGEVWEAQEKLWVQGALLDVIAKVNAKANAKDWESAPVKQITLLEIGSETAQDQQSLAKGETLVEPEDLIQPGVEAPVEAVAADASAMGEMSSMYGSMGGMAAADARIRFIQPEGGQYRVYPVSLSVLVDQNYIQNFLVEFANSPMAIQVKDFEMQRPKTRVTKPQAGQTLGFSPMGGYAGGMMGSSYSQPYMMSSDMMSSGMMSSSMGMGGMGGYPTSGYGMGMGGLGKPSTAKDIRTKTSKKETTPKTKVEAAKVELYDPYYNIVEVHVYGQARFYNPPPPVEEPAPESEAAPAEGTPAEGTPAEGTPAEASTTETPAAAPSAEPAPASPAAPEPAPAEASPATPPAAETAPATPAAGAAEPPPPPDAANAPAEAPKAESAAPKR